MPPTELPPDDIELAAFPVIIDIRTDPAASGRIPGSLHIDAGDVAAIERAIPDPDTPVLLYCGIGELSRIVADDLTARGYGNVVSLLGGIRRWSAASLPIEKNDAPDRYDRHTRLAGIGPEGQERITESRVLVVGAGGLGSPVIQYLAAAGVGTIGIVDGDRVDITNLQRQVLFAEESIGRNKSEAAAEAVHRLNRHVSVHPIAAWLDGTNADGLVAGYDLVIDASDNFATRLAVNDAAAAAGIPFIHGAAIRWEGMVAGFEPAAGPCYRCLFPDLPNEETTCSDVGVLGAVTGVIGSLMAVEAMKHLIGSPDRLIDRLITYDARSATFHSLRIVTAASCPIAHDRGRVGR